VRLCVLCDSVVSLCTSPGFVETQVTQGKLTLNKGRIMIRKLKSGEYRLYSKKKDPKTGKRKNLGTFATRAAAEKHERAVQYFKRH
jgi:hypothetical protein